MSETINNDLFESIDPIALDYALRFANNLAPEVVEMVIQLSHHIGDLNERIRDLEQSEKEKDEKLIKAQNLIFSITPPSIEDDAPEWADSFVINSGYENRGRIMEMYSGKKEIISKRKGEFQQLSKHCKQVIITVNKDHGNE